MALFFHPPIAFIGISIGEEVTTVQPTSLVK